VDPTGLKRYDILARVGHGPDRQIQTQLVDTLPKNFKAEELQRPTLEQVEQETEDARRALNLLVQAKTAKTQPKNVIANTESQVIRYTPSGSSDSRIIKMTNMPVDPFEPPKFHHKRIPRPPASPPAPRLHSPPRKTTREEQLAWHVPPCISSWKNPKGYTVPLDKRLASDGRGLQEHSLNGRMADLAEALHVAERTKREEVELRAAVAQKVAEQEQRARDARLREIAEKARDDARRLAEDLGRAARHEADHELGSGMGLTIRERERVRQDRAYERERELRMSRMSATQRAKLVERDAERDVSEQIALGVARPTDQESLYDQRLFDRTQGIGAGHGGGEDDLYNLYDKPLFSGTAIHSLYRPTAEGEQPLSKSAFGGAEAATVSEGPVRFERKDDPFGVDTFLAEAKKGKRGLDTRTDPEAKRKP
jgi:SNW domain-containing protein 1